MERRTALLLLALALGAYGVYRAVYTVAMLLGPIVSPVLLVAFALEAVLALAAAIGVAAGQRWAAAALLLLGASVAATALIEGFVLGIVAWLYALGIAIAAVVAAFLLAGFVRRGDVPARGIPL